MPAVAIRPGFREDKEVEAQACRPGGIAAAGGGLRSGGAASPKEPTLATRGRGCSTTLPGSGYGWKKGPPLARKVDLAGELDFTNGDDKRQALVLPRPYRGRPGKTL